jgi:hypothetical protein
VNLNPFSVAQQERRPVQPLITWLEDQKLRSESYLQQVLLGEDIARLRRLDAMLAAASTREDFRKHALYAGWSADDLRTHELLPALEPLIDLLWMTKAGNPEPRQLVDAWTSLQDLRMERLVGCLARSPKPVA